MQQLIEWFQSHSPAGSSRVAAQFFERPENLLPEFTYAGTPFRAGKWQRTFTSNREAAFEATYLSPDGLLKLRISGRFHRDFPVFEYRPVLEAAGEEETGLVENFRSFAFRFDGLGQNCPVKLRTLSGTHCTADDFTPGEIVFPPAANQSLLLDNSVDARSSSSWMPYFELEIGDRGGMLAALGWSGTWKAAFQCGTEQTTFPTFGANFFKAEAGLAETRFRMRPGECFRQGSALFYFREAGQPDNEFQTALYAFMRACKTPRDGKGALFAPRFPITSGGGSKTPEMMLKHIEFARASGIGFDTLWIDAGWSGEPHEVDPAVNCGGNWYRYVGDWQFNTTVHPDGNLKRVSEAARRAGMKLLLWFEPERVFGGVPLLAEHPEYVLDCPRDGSETEGKNWLFDLGNPEARAYIAGVVAEVLKTNSIGIYRQDFNTNPLLFWRAKDAREGEDRVGVAESKYITGLYEYWDELRRRVPDLLIENCASGGRRLDFELVSRSHSYCRTDYAIGCFNPELQATNAQNITLNLSPFVPFSGGETAAGATWRKYDLLSTFSAAPVFTPSDWEQAIVKRDFTSEELVLLKKYFGAARRMNRLYAEGDFHPLTERTDLSQECWCAWQMHVAGKAEGFAIFFRRPSAKSPSRRMFLQGIDEAELYDVEFFDGPTTSLRGKDLAIFLSEPDADNVQLLFYQKRTS